MDFFLPREILEVLAFLRSFNGSTEISHLQIIQGHAARIFMFGSFGVSNKSLIESLRWKIIQGNIQNECHRMISESITGLADNYSFNPIKNLQCYLFDFKIQRKTSGYF